MELYPLPKLTRKSTFYFFPDPYRSKIEVMFLFLKHLLGGFCYHFWTKAFPQLKRGKKPDLSTLSKSDLEKVDRTVKAIEGFINLAGIAMGLLQYLALTQGSGDMEQLPGVATTTFI